MTETATLVVARVAAGLGTIQSARTPSFQLFCCNFGSTHSIHHFWVPDPFHTRRLTAPAVGQSA